ncbi:MDR family MFS transporter [Clostridioides sp. ZZV15-6598]|uniref:MDR family MFS transporter n=1 Tax=Clostridioides sp. ZZV15-6598 TaxID=2811501 RepID=UPI001D0FB85B|nr:multidrug efflux MFS transporter [Clostridioides sp. ZZV15-6598]
MEIQSNRKNNKKENLIIAIVMTGAFISSLSQTLLSTALPNIMSDFKITADVGQWLTTIYLLIAGIIIPTTAYLINRFSTRKLFITSMAIFSLGCVIALFSRSFSTMLIARVLQAVGSGSLMPLLQVIILYLCPVEKRGTAMSLVGITVGFAPAIGPTLSGWLVDSFGWHSLFLLLSPIAILDVILSFILLKNVGEAQKLKLDIPSIILSSLGFGGLLIGFTNQGNYGWANSATYLPIILGIVSLILFTWRQLKSKEPFLELRVFKNKPFLISTLLIMIVYASMMSATLMIPLYIQSVRGFSALASGSLMMPGAILMVALNPVAGRHLDKYGPHALSILGTGCLFLGTLSFAFLGKDTSLIHVSLMYCIRMIGISMVLMPLTTWGIKTLDRELISHATAINSTLRQIAGAIGSAVLITIMTTATKKAHMGSTILSNIHGIDVAFSIAATLAFIGLIISICFIKERQTVRS